ncbi:MAG: PAS domain S-box protein, partial [Gammaproteobacteria bacterium]|nr:PAS domain S-box protein [Gammaproteobacteria bacterium]
MDAGTTSSRDVPFQLLVESIQDYAIFMLDPAGRIVSWNSGARRLKGYRADEVLGSHFSRFYPEETRRSGWPEYELMQAASDGRFEDEGWRIRKDGSRFWASVIITALRDENGELIGYVKVTRDLTQSKRLEALEESERRMSEFLAVLSHELRNPLAPIRTMMDLFKTKELQDPQLDMIRSVIDSQVSHLTRVVADLLDIARIQHGLVAVRRGPVALADVVAHAVQAVRPLIEQKSHDLDVADVDPALHVEGDFVRLSQALIYLLNNAAQYTDPGGHIELAVSRDGPDAVISVSDNGRGIDPAALPDIFAMFGRRSGRRSDSDTGLGIGLGLVKRLAELHDGRVEAHSEGIGCGSRFTIRLPLLPATESAEPREPDRPDSDAAAQPRQFGGRRRIMVVDDNRDFAESLAMLLESLGHETKMAHRGKQAIELAERYRPETVFLDIGLPDLDGYEVARRLRTLLGEKCVLAALTGWGQES